MGRSSRCRRARSRSTQAVRSTATTWCRSNASGSKIVTKGTTKRKCPTQPANTCLLAIVFVPAGATVVTSGNVYDARMLASQLGIAAAIQCYGAIGCQTGNIGAWSQFVDVPGDSVTRKTVSMSTTLHDRVWTNLLTVTVPMSYSATEASNARFRVNIPDAPPGYTGSALDGRVMRGGAEIGSATVTRPYGPTTVTIDTTVGFRAGDVLVIAARWDAGGTMHGSVTATSVSITSDRSTVTPAKKVFLLDDPW